MQRLFAAALLLVLPASAGVRLGLETQTYSLLPSFYEPITRWFYGLSAEYPVLPNLSVRAAISNNLDYWDMPYNDVSNFHSHTYLLRLGADYQVYQAGPARLFLGAGLLRMTSSWKADDYAYEDPTEPREFWDGRFSHWALEGAPRLELFREKQKVDWSVSLALVYHLAFATDLEDEGKALEQRFREAYLNDAGMGIRFAVGLGFGL